MVGHDGAVFRSGAGVQAEVVQAELPILLGVEPEALGKVGDQNVGGDGDGAFHGIGRDVPDAHGLAVEVEPDARGSAAGGEREARDGECTREVAPDELQGLISLHGVGEDAQKPEGAVLGDGLGDRPEPRGVVFGKDAGEAAAVLQDQRFGPSLAKQLGRTFGDDLA